MRRGRLRACGVPLDKQNVEPLKDSALIRHFLHRHEPPVQDLPVTILHETDDVRNPASASTPNSPPLPPSGLVGWVKHISPPPLHSHAAWNGSRGTTAQAVVVMKPASMPVHHCGQYRKNTVVGMLAAMHGLTDIKPLHRLDRPVSGATLPTMTGRPASSQRHPASSQRHPASSQRHPASS